MLLEIRIGKWLGESFVFVALSVLGRSSYGLPTSSTLLLHLGEQTPWACRRLSVRRVEWSVLLDARRPGDPQPGPLPPLERLRDSNRLANLLPERLRDPQGRGVGYPTAEPKNQRSEVDPNPRALAQLKASLPVSRMSVSRRPGEGSLLRTRSR